MNSQMHWDAIIERVRKCDRRPRSSELRDALGHRDLGEFGDALGGYDRASLEMQLETEIE